MSKHTYIDLSFNMADKQLQILANLIKAVSNVAERGAPQPESTQNNGEDSTATVEDAIKRLFPSTEG